MLLELKQVSKKFGDFFAVKDINLQMEHGVYGLLGANGAGKTTLMRMLCTLLHPTSGTILYDGEEIWSMNEKYRKWIGYLPQDFGYYPEFTAKNYLLYIAALKGLKATYARKKTDELLHLVSLWNVRNKKIQTFSGGMKRRLGIAQSVLNDPLILILDEPTSGLDPKERIRFRNLISELAKDRIILLSTHIVSDVESISNHILIMKEGSIVQQGTVEDLLIPLKNKVWKVTIADQKMKNFSKNHVITTMKNEGSMVQLRFIEADDPDIDLEILESAETVEPSLEDLFLYYFREEEDNDDLQI